jgi:hypothetical protein
MKTTRATSRFQNPKIRFLARGVAFLLGFCFFNYALMTLLEESILSQDYFMWRWKYDLATQPAHSSFDLLWLGDSRVLGAIHPTLMDTPLGKKGVNLAGGGMQFPAMYFLLKRYLENPTHSPPQAVFLSQAPYAWNAHKDFLERHLKYTATWSEFYELAPWLYHEGHLDLLWNYPLICLKSAYSFNPECRGSLFKRGAHNRRVLEEMKTQQGFRAWSEKKLSLKDPLETHLSFTPTALNLFYFEQIVALCKNHQLRLIFITLPVPQSRESALRQAKNRLLQDYQQRLSQYAKDKHFVYIPEIPFWEDHYFTDWSHLNQQGAQLYSHWLTQQIPQWLDPQRFPCW